MKMKKIFLIGGGQHHREYETIPEEAETFSVSQFGPSTLSEAESVMMGEPTKSDNYTRRSISLETVEKEKIEIFGHESLSDEEVLEKLLNGR